MTDQPRILLVNDKQYRLFEDDSTFRNKDFLEGFRPDFHSEVARLIGEGLGSEKDRDASLGIRLLHGSAVETFLAMLFATMQAPEAPAAWLLLYRADDIRALISRFNSGKPLPSRIAPTNPGSWAELTSMFLPVDFPPEGRGELIEKTAKLWQRLAHEYLDETAYGEYNAIKHGLRARPASQTVFVGPEELRGEKHGSVFPLARRRNRNVLLKIGGRSWSAIRLLAELRLISSALRNFVAILRHIHGIGTPGELEVDIPDEADFEAAEPSGTLSSVRIGPEFVKKGAPPSWDEAQWLEHYVETSGPLEVRGKPDEDVSG